MTSTDPHSNSLEISNRNKCKLHSVNFMALLKMESAMECPVDARFTCDKAAVFGDRIRGTFLTRLGYIVALY
jgi:hypothetical protein